MDELEDEGKKEDLGFLLNRAIDYLDEIGLTPAEKFKAEISDTLQRMIEKEKRKKGESMGKDIPLPMGT